MNNLFFQDINQNYKVCLDEVAYEDILLCCTNSISNETGGILIGKYSNDNMTAMVLQATEPPKNSKCFKAKFYRGTKGLQKVLDAAWKQGEYYLGEWHYHPNFSAVPSSIDIKQMISLSKNKALKCPQPILLIIGGNKNNWSLSVSVFNGDGQVDLKKL